MLDYALIFGGCSSPNFGLRLLYNFLHGIFEDLSLELQTVLVPNKVRCGQIELVAFHAAFEEREDVTVVRVSHE